MTATDVAVVGAGLTGALLAVRLARRGHTVTLYERRGDPRLATVHEGRSINLAMSTRGLDALERAGLAADVRAHGVPMHGRMIHERDGDLVFQRYSNDPHHHLLSVDRDRLNATLLDAAEREAGVSLRFGHKLVDVALGSDAVTFEHDGARVEARHPVVLGADGAYSAVRARLQRTDRFHYEQDYLEHGYKELTIPAAPDGTPRLDTDALHIWPRGGHMMIALPNPDGTFTCTLFWPFGGPSGFETIDTATEVADVFARDFTDALGLVPDLAEQYLRNPTSSLVTIRCAPWNLGGRALLLGDAAHAVVPFYGQGANAALEDVTILLDLLDETDDDWARAFATFATTRKPDADALADLALDNFVEMRDKVASPLFRAQTRMRQAAERLLPRRYVPLYEMVTFSRTPYAEAVRRAERQDVVALRMVAALLVAVVVCVVLGVLAWS